MASTWCHICGTDHTPPEPCPGELRPTGRERSGWRAVVETPHGLQGFGVLLCRVGQRWRAQIRTFPHVLWSVPGGGGSIKFLGRSAEESERKAIAFIREHCAENEFVLHPDLGSDRDSPEAATRVRAPVVAGPASDDEPSAPTPRYDRCLPVRFGRSRPIAWARTENLSEDGLFVATRQPFEEGQLVGLMLELEHCKVPLRGSVMWQRDRRHNGRPPGMGLRLLYPPSIYVDYVHALG